MAAVVIGVLGLIWIIGGILMVALSPRR